MKKYLLLCFLVLASLTNFAQLSGINTKAANTNTYLHLDESGAATKVYKGVLTSRYSTSDRNTEFGGLTAAENGLLIYNTTENCYNYWKHNGTTGTWVSLCGCLPGAPSDFLYYANCGAAVANPSALNLGANTTGGTITVPIVVTNSGTIKAYLATINGVTFSNDAIPVNSSTTSYTINFSGTPAELAPIVVPINDNNDNIICNVTIPVIYGPAAYACNKVDKFGNYIAGIALTSSNYLEVEFDVTAVGNYPVMTYIGNGMTFTAPAGLFNTTGNKLVTFTALGTPTAAGTFAMTPSDATKMCVYDLTVTAAFSYTYTCGPYNAATLPNFKQYVSTSGSFTIPVSVTGTGIIPATSVLNNGITYNITASSATSSTTFLTVTYSGTPVNAGSTVFSVGACSYAFPVTVGIASFTCDASPLANVQGTYQVGYGLTAANKFDVNFNVSATGTYAAMSYSGGGMTFTAPAGNFSSTGNNVVTFTASPISATNKPTTFGANALTYSGPATGCSVSIPVTYGAAQFTCTATPVSAITGTYNVDYDLTASNTFVVTYSVTVPGTYPSLALGGGGMSFSTPTGTFTGTGTQPGLTYTATTPYTSNVPNTFGNNTLTGTGSPGGCAITIPVAYGNAVYSCTASSVSTAAPFVVQTPLTALHYAKLTLTVTKRGYASIVTAPTTRTGGAGGIYDENGIKFGVTDTLLTTNATGQPIVLNRMAAADPYPMMSEELWNGKYSATPPANPGTLLNGYTATVINAPNNQTSTYKFRDVKVVPNADLASACTITIDVKPISFTTATPLTMDYQSSNPYWTSNSTTNGVFWATNGSYASSMPTDGRIQLDVSNKRLSSSLAINYWWNNAVKNVTPAPALPATNNISNWEALYEGAADANTTAFSTAGTNLAINGRVGSFDPYLQSNGGAVSFSGNDGAIGIGLGYEEVDDYGFIFQYVTGGKWYKYRAVFDGYNPGSGAYKLKVTLVLFGIYSTKPDNFYPPLTYSATGGTPTPGSRDAKSYNP